MSGIEFEYVDLADRLGESSPTSRHVTQADVAISATLGDGRRHLILIEVKLSEDDFGHCTGYEDPTNDRIEGCQEPDGFEGGSESCFKLANHNRGGHRTYNLYVLANTPSNARSERRTTSQCATSRDVTFCDLPATDVLS